MAQAQQALTNNPDFEGDVSGKVTIHAIGVANAPKLIKAKFATKEDSQFSKVSVYLRNQLKLKPEDNLFFFIKNSFQPPMDARIKDLCDVSQITPGFYDS